MPLATCHSSESWNPVQNNIRRVPRSNIFPLSLLNSLAVFNLSSVISRLSPSPALLSSAVCCPIKVKFLTKRIFGLIQDKKELPKCYQNVTAFIAPKIWVGNAHINQEASGGSLFAMQRGWLRYTIGYGWISTSGRKKGLSWCLHHKKSFLENTKLTNYLCT